MSDYSADWMRELLDDDSGAADDNAPEEEIPREDTIPEEEASSEETEIGGIPPEYRIMFDAHLQELSELSGVPVDEISPGQRVVAAREVLGKINKYAAEQEAARPKNLEQVIATRIGADHVQETYDKRFRGGFGFTEYDATVPFPVQTTVAEVLRRRIYTRKLKPELVPAESATRLGRARERGRASRTRIDDAVSANVRRIDRDVDGFLEHEVGNFVQRNELRYVHLLSGGNVADLVRDAIDLNEPLMNSAIKADTTDSRLSKSIFNNNLYLGIRWGVQTAVGSIPVLGSFINAAYDVAETFAKAIPNVYAKSRFYFRGIRRGEFGTVANLAATEVGLYTAQLVKIGLNLLPDELVLPVAGPAGTEYVSAKIDQFVGKIEEKDAYIEAANEILGRSISYQTASAVNRKILDLRRQAVDYKMAQMEERGEEVDVSEVERIVERDLPRLRFRKKRGSFNKYAKEKFWKEKWGPEGRTWETWRRRRYNTERAVRGTYEVAKKAARGVGHGIGPLVPAF